MSIINTGNTCYLGTALQCLMSVNRLNLHLLENNNDPFIKSFVYVCKQLEHGFNNIQPIELYTHIRSKYQLFNNHEEHDAHEAIQVLLDLLSNHTDVINDSFRVEFKSVVRCGACGHVVTSYQHEYGLLEHSLCMQKPLSDYRCDRCRCIGMCVLDMSVNRLPPCLILKSTRCKSTVLKTHGDTYYLKAVCKHFEQNLTGRGHYVAVVRKNDSCWYLKDDAKTDLLFEDVDNLDPLFVDGCFFVFETR